MNQLSVQVHSTSLESPSRSLKMLLFFINKTLGDYRCHEAGQYILSAAVQKVEDVEGYVEGGT